MTGDHEHPQPIGLEVAGQTAALLRQLVDAHPSVVDRRNLTVHVRDLVRSTWHQLQDADNPAPQVAATVQGLAAFAAAQLVGMALKASSPHTASQAIDAVMSDSVDTPGSTNTLHALQLVSTYASAKPELRPPADWVSSRAALAATTSVACQILLERAAAGL